MKKLTVLIVLLMSINAYSQNQADDYTIELARRFSKDIFENNGVPFMQPVVKIMNATSNSGFYNESFVPPKVDKPYFKFSIKTMMGLIPDDLRAYQPYMPNEEFSTTGLIAASKINPFQYQELLEVETLEELEKLVDMDGLLHYFFLNLMYDGIYGEHAGLISIPKSASTAFDDKNTQFQLPDSNMHVLIESHPIYDQLPGEFQDSVKNLFNEFPDTFTLYGGQEMQQVFAAVPQIEIGSVYGTELLLRFIPPLDYGKTIGEFSFYGVGLKHNISQYFTDDLDIALQVVYQGTHLENEIGVTKADLVSDAQIWNFNFHLSKEIKNYFRVFTGLSYDMINIDSEYTYYLPIEIQRQLGMIEKGKEGPTPGYPGDQNPQKSKLELEDKTVKFTLGAVKDVGDFTFALAYNMSDYHVFNLGIQYKLDLNK